MADITDERVIEWCNTVFRPLCEEMRRVHVLFTNAKTQWTDGGLSTLVPNDDSDLIDNRPTVPPLEGQDIWTVLGHFAGVLAVLDAAGVMDNIKYPCVRTLKVCNG